MNNILKIGIPTAPQQRARSLAIATGTRKRGGVEGVEYPAES
jgi:hypothetical protein